jgi:poly-gamma-glutamate synthesis protein (capsule biosynthesis protein)
MRIALAGDLLVTRRLRGAIDSGYLSSLTAVTEAADLAIANLETLLHDYSSPASAVSGGSWLRAEPDIASELREIGFAMLARANNHAMDFGVAALLETSRHLKHAGVHHAGAGTCLADALAPAVYDTASGRVALVSACSTLPVGAEATRPRGAIPGRCGIAPLRHHMRYTVPEPVLRTLREVTGACLIEPGSNPEGVAIGRHLFVGGDGYAVSSDPDTEDLESLVESVAEARRVADMVLVSIHSQECDDDPNWYRPPRFLRLAARRVADAGAIAVFGHGPHILRGLEVHRGVPILYSLGTLFFQNDVLARYPDDARRAYGLPPYPPCEVGDRVVEARKLASAGYDFRADSRFSQTVVAVIDGDSAGCAELTLVPFTVDPSESLTVRGLPRRADDRSAAQIINRLTHLSADLGVTLRSCDGVAYLRLRD